MNSSSEGTESIHYFIEEKNRFEHEGWEIVYIFESRFIPDNIKMYGDIMKKLEVNIDNEKIEASKMKQFLKFRPIRKKFDAEVRAVKIIHPATRNGFRAGTIFLEDEFEKDYGKENAVMFIEQFKKIVTDKKLVPDKTVIILSKEPHHLFTPKIAQSRKKTLDTASKRKGQKLVTQYFQTVKNPNQSAANSPSTSKDSEIYVEKITQQFRGDLVKILWIPKDNFEVDPSQYLAIFLLNEISNDLMKKPPGDENTSLKDVVREAIDLFPNAMWERVVKLAGDFEDAYFEDEDETDTESNATATTAEQQ